jgi:subtilisin family serine protease
VYCAEPNYYDKVASIPNDYVSSIQYAIENINLPDTWGYMVGSKDVTVGVIDTGIDGTNPDLQDNLNIDLSKNFSSDFTSALEDLEGHGTHVAGIIGAVGNNNVGITGANWNVSIVSLRVADSEGDFPIDNVIEAIDYAHDDEVNIDILNYSGGGYNYNDQVETRRQAIANYDGLFVCAAGNDKLNTDIELHYPSTHNLSNLISVGSLDQNNNRSYFSNFGLNTVNIYAPGSSILSTYPVDICNEYYEFSDGTLLCELDRDLVRMLKYEIESSEESIDWDYIDENFADIVYIYIKGIIDKDEIVPKLFKISQHHNTGYHYMDGTSMATPYVAGVAALLLSMNKDLSPIELKTAILQGADEITITIPKNGVGCAPDSTEEQDVLKLNAYNAVKYVLDNYMNPSTYTLSNYGGAINASKTITSDASYFDELNGFYKLNVTYSKNYEFISSSTSGIEVTLYDEDFTEIPFNDLDSTSNKVHFIENLSTGTYYLKTKYDNEESIGTISTQIVLRTAAYIGVGDNDLLLNTYNNISEYVYTNNQGPGIYRFKLNGTTIDETSITYPSNSLVLYTNSTRSIEANKLYFDEDEILVYLPSNGAYYLNINLNEASYSSLSINISSIEKNTIDYINGLTSIRFNIIFENENSLYYYEEVTIKQKSEIQLDIMTSGTITDSIPVYVYSRIFNEETNKYDLVETFIGEITPIDRVPVYTLVLDAGTYYFGYKNNIDNTNINFGIRRMVDYNMNMEGILVADPDETGFELGTEVLINKGECNKYYITEGFTRNIYLLAEDKFSIPISRLDYDWYSSNEAVATVTNYGTVLAMPVTTDTEVTIYAVLKDDPKIVYYRTFTVLNDEEENLEEIILNMSYSYVAENGTYQLELTNINCPYPMIQYYSWNIVNNSEETVTMNYWGQISSTGTCTVLIEGTYNLNSRVRLYITLTIE